MRSRRIRREVIRRAACAVDAADRVVTRAWLGAMTPEERLEQLYPDALPVRPAPVGNLTRFAFLYETTDVPPGQTLTEYRKARRR